MMMIHHMDLLEAPYSNWNRLVTSGGIRRTRVHAGIVFILIAPTRVGWCCCCPGGGWLMGTSSEYTRLRASCLNTGVLYEDADFDAIASSIGSDAYCRPYTFEWRRPAQIIDAPVFVIDDRARFDAIASSLGAWRLVSALSTLWDYRSLFYRAVPADQGFPPTTAYAGVFHFRFYWRAEWRDVIVDDRLPTVRGRQLMFIHSQTSAQFWPALIEKAYAKLHGSYEALQYATMSDIMCELTGGCCESSPVAGLALHLESILETSQRDEEETSGGRRAYNILSIDASSAKIQIRAPPPGDEHQQIDTPHIVRNQRSSSSQCALFVYLDRDTCRSESRFHSTRTFVGNVHSGAWMRGVTAGGCRKHNTDTFAMNPQLLVSMPHRDVLIVSVQQMDMTHVIGVSIYKVSAEHSTTDRLDTDYFRSHRALAHSIYSNMRQIAYRLDPVGTDERCSYMLIPNCYNIGDEGTFSLRVLSPKPVKMTLVDMETSMTADVYIATNSIYDCYRDMFDSFATGDGASAGKINAHQLHQLLLTSLPNDYMKSCANRDVCRRAMHAIADDGAGHIDYRQFCQLLTNIKHWQQIFARFSDNNSALKAERLRPSLQSVGITVSCEVLLELIGKFMRPDGTLRFGDFCACILNLLAAFKAFSRRDKVGNGTIRLDASQWVTAVIGC